jgi:hypothetical protein
MYFIYLSYKTPGLSKGSQKIILRALPKPNKQLLAQAF